MNTIYFPLLKAKDAEFTALKNASASTKQNIIPLFEIPKFNPDLKKYKDNPHAKATYLSELCKKIGECLPGQFVMFDAYNWQDPAETVESGEHHVSYLFNGLKSAGVNAVPVVGYDRWDVDDYRLALKGISKIHNGKFCIRLDSFAFEDAGDPAYFQSVLTDIIEHLEIVPSNCHIVLDFGDVSQMSLVDIFKNFDSLFSQIAFYNFFSYSIAGCSLPNSIDKVIKEQDSSGQLLRKEMLLWKSARKQYSLSPIYFGDYGVRGPSTAETGFGNTNAKIRYTVSNEYFIVRGHVIRKPIGGYQHCGLAKTLINSGRYLNPTFSWGDSEILRCSNGEFGGSATTWIEIDTSHHLAYVVTEIAEFERSLVVQKAQAGNS